ncbi:MAG: hypothetical protein LBK99_27545 [Opitutaceae bacterium]|jgi:hypothetical protein|nr:hypothetical protein [Opitutaceae bacterium]
MTTMTIKMLLAGLTALALLVSAQADITVKKSDVIEGKYSYVISYDDMAETAPKIAKDASIFSNFIVVNEKGKDAMRLLTPNPVEATASLTLVFDFTSTGGAPVRALIADRLFLFASENKSVISTSYSFDNSSWTLLKRATAEAAAVAPAKVDIQTRENEPISIPDGVSRFFYRVEVKDNAMYSYKSQWGRSGLNSTPFRIVFDIK